ncbi:hypothetical protein V1477_007616 [Vespula maculifrons]|uniref:Uncharacterized protein n=1 Tax=Vespula maculifrons TaxID=7453 RepID=A0ABD2CGC2_VESMC
MSLTFIFKMKPCSLKSFKNYIWNCYWLTALELCDKRKASTPIVEFRINARVKISSWRNHDNLFRHFNELSIDDF